MALVHGSQADLMNGSKKENSNVQGSNLILILKLFVNKKYPTFHYAKEGVILTFYTFRK